VHQEDFCQALGNTSDHKYQREGGPSLAQCFDLVRSVSSVPVIDLQALLSAVFFNLIIGNNDAHGKNFSLLRLPNAVRFAPLYDLISTVHYPSLSKRMAMKIGGEYEAQKLLPRHIDRMAEEIGMAKAAVGRQLSLLVDRVVAALSEFKDGDARFGPIIDSVERNALQIAERLG
jgi:serine/threonine-protein kinase HipA